MERRDGLCVVRFGAEPDVAWKVGRIMLKYRPIAPKPVAGGAAAAPPALADGSGAGRKRKGGPVRDGRRGRKSRKTLAAAMASTAATTNDKHSKKVDSPVSHPLSSSPSSSSTSYSSSPPPPPPSALLQMEQNVVTLPLMPETPERKEEKAAQPASPSPLDLALPCLPHLWRPELGVESAFQRPSAVEVVAPRPVRPAGSWVALECVEETWRDGELCGGADADLEVRRSINGEQACPAFISDAYEKVTWVNESYKKMVVGGEEDEEVRVALVTKGNVPAGRAFTCRVRVRNASRRGRGTMTAPCDVWRFEDGTLGWRLDVKAALSLACYK